MLAALDGLDQLLAEGDQLAFGNLTADIYETPGHTSGHISLHFASANVLFSGDTCIRAWCAAVVRGHTGADVGFLIEICRYAR